MVDKRTKPYINPKKAKPKTNAIRQFVQKVVSLQNFSIKNDEELIDLLNDENFQEFMMGLDRYIGLLAQHEVIRWNPEKKQWEAA